MDTNEDVLLTREAAINWSVRLYPQAKDQKQSKVRLRFCDYQSVLANHRQTEIMLGVDDLPEALSNAVFGESFPGTQFPFNKRGCLQPHGVMGSRRPPTEADLRWGTTLFTRKLLQAAESVPTVSDVRLQELIARFGTPRPYGSRGLYAAR